MQEFSRSLTLFLSLLVEAIPFLILGVLVSGILLFFVDEKKLIEFLPDDPLLGALAGSLIGFLFPVCECGNVPVARRLLSKGVSAPVAIGFLLAAPTINPVVVWATWIAFRDQPEIVILRMIFSLAIATIIGWVFSAGDLKPFLQPSLAAIIPNQSSLEPDEDVPTLLRSGTFLLDKPGKPIRLDASNFQAVLAPETPKVTAWRDRFRAVIGQLPSRITRTGWGSRTWKFNRHYYSGGGTARDYFRTGARSRILSGGDDDLGRCDFYLLNGRLLLCPFVCDNVYEWCNPRLFSLWSYVRSQRHGITANGV